MNPYRIFSSDVIIVGTGVAGLTAALSVSHRHVALLTKTSFGGGGSSVWAQGGIAAAVGDDDSPTLHASDTIHSGVGLADPKIVELITQEGPKQINKLIAMGAEFDRTAQGGLDLRQEGAHSRRRVIHAHGDATGLEMVRALSEVIKTKRNIEIFEQSFACDLVVEGGRVVGIWAIDQDGTRSLHLAPAVVLGTGGIGYLYKQTTNPPESTGDGLAMAARAGVRLVDIEFVQFHPTALYSFLDPMPLLTEALRGEGALLINESGERFVDELAPRDVVSRAIWQEIENGSSAHLDCRESIGEEIKQKFPTVFSHCQRAGLDPGRDLIPVSPAAHYHMGGIAIDPSGRTSLPGLWACGECAGSGVHGANRLASNSLLEAIVFGARVAADIETENPSTRLSTRKVYVWPATMD
ncbi:MAG TPA: L-aspartate oxidase, partial [Bdellovibrionota bacterium]|nr:L-aspartate oxidase [Bdellovibrionota bacterium]